MNQIIEKIRWHRTKISMCRNYSWIDWLRQNVSWINDRWLKNIWNAKTNNFKFRNWKLLSKLFLNWLIVSKRVENKQSLIERNKKHDRNFHFLRFESRRAKNFAMKKQNKRWIWYAIEKCKRCYKFEQCWKNNNERFIANLNIILKMLMFEISEFRREKLLILTFWSLSCVMKKINTCLNFCWSTKISNRNFVKYYSSTLFKKNSIDVWMQTSTIIY